jgi:hypothetical protein
MLAPSATLCFSLKIHQRAFEKGSGNKNTEAQRAQRGWEIRTKLRDLCASVFQRDYFTYTRSRLLG